MEAKNDTAGWGLAGDFTYRLSREEGGAERSWKGKPYLFDVAP